MKPISHFALESIAPVAADVPSRSRLRFGGQPLRTTLRGSCLEAQFRLDSRFLLIVTDDLPYEETVRFYLLDPTFDVIDQLELGAPYSPGILREVDPIAPDRLEFSFSGNDRWQLTIRETPVSWLGALKSRASRGGRHSSRNFMVLTRVGPDS